MYFVSLHDARGRFLAWTKSHPDWPPERLRGLVAWDTTHPEDRTLVAREFAAGAKGMREFIARDLAGVWYRVKVYPVSGLPPVVVVCVSYSIHRGDRFRLLTARQREVFDLTVEGLSIRDIAKTLKITNQRVANHRSEIRKKLRLPTTSGSREGSGRHQGGIACRVPQGDRKPASTTGCEVESDTAGRWPRSTKLRPFDDAGAYCTRVHASCRAKTTSCGRW